MFREIVSHFILDEVQELQVIIWVNCQLQNMGGEDQDIYFSFTPSQCLPNINNIC